MARPRVLIQKPINWKWSSSSRQQKRHELFRDTFADLMKRYGGESRRTLRVLARAAMHIKWQDRNPHHAHSAVGK